MFIVLIVLLVELGGCCWLFSGLLDVWFSWVGLGYYLIVGLLVCLFN